jgi:hypothetical protein
VPVPVPCAGCEVGAAHMPLLKKITARTWTGAVRLEASETCIYTAAAKNADLALTPTSVL